MQLSSIDLNLLVVLGALLKTCSVKDAAVQLGLSASATSHALGRLRELLGDPILVRAGQTMVLSARAERLRPHVFRLLEQVEELLEEDDSFDPRTLSRTFRVSAVDYIDGLILAPLSAHLAREAPGVDLFAQPPGDAVRRLRNGALDLVIGVFPSPPPDLQSEVLIVDKMVCVMREGHPLSQKRLTLARYLSVPHVLTAPTGGERAVVDEALEKQGKARRLARTTTTFEGALQRVTKTDYLVTIPERPARRFAKELGLVLRSVPLPLDSFAFSMLWHRRQNDEPSHQWLREQLLARARDV